MSPTADIAEIPVTPTEPKAYGALDRFRPGTNFAAWLYRIMVNSYINGYRKQRRPPRRHLAAERGYAACEQARAIAG
jgi:RNA polymerase sigma-70 factor, ECF subfamily